MELPRQSSPPRRGATELFSISTFPTFDIAILSLNRNRRITGKKFKYSRRQWREAVLVEDVAVDVGEDASRFVVAAKARTIAAEAEM